MTILAIASVSVFENLSKVWFLCPFGLPYESGCNVFSSECKVADGLVSSSAVCYGLIVLPRNFSPDGDLGGVCPFGEY